MIGITVDGVDFSDRLIFPDGLSIVRESIDRSDFYAVGSTARVRMSDIDGTVRGALNAQHGFADPVIQMLRDGENIFSGVFSPGTDTTAKLNLNNPDSESITEFEVMDDLLDCFRQWQRRPFNPLTIPYNVPGGLQIIHNGAAFYVVELTAWLQYLTDLPGVTRPWIQEIQPTPIYLEVDLGPDGNGNYHAFSLSRIAGTSWTSRIVRPGVVRSTLAHLGVAPRPYFISDFISDISAWFLADVYLENGVFYLRNRSEYRPVRPHAVIDEYSELITIRDNGMNVDEVEDRHWVGDQPALWYHYLLSEGTRMTREKPEGKSMASIIPGFTDAFTMHEMAFFQFEYDGAAWVRKDWSHHPQKYAQIIDLLTKRTYSKVVTTGLQYYPGQKAIISGEEYRIEGADLMPLTDDAELIVSQPLRY